MSHRRFFCDEPVFPTRFSTGLVEIGKRAKFAQGVSRSCPESERRQGAAWMKRREVPGDAAAGGIRVSAQILWRYSTSGQMVPQGRRRKAGSARVSSCLESKVSARRPVGPVRAPGGGIAATDASSACFQPVFTSGQPRTTAGGTGGGAGRG